MIGKNLFKGVPPLIVEILSPFNEDVDREEKYAEYAALGVGIYWIVDFPNRCFEVHRLDKGAYRLAETIKGAATFCPSEYPGLEIPLARLWPSEFEDRAD